MGQTYRHLEMSTEETEVNRSIAMPPRDEEFSNLMCRVQLSSVGWLLHESEVAEYSVRYHSVAATATC